MKDGEVKRSVAFSMPGGDSRTLCQGRPIDMAHLARQTLDDRGLEQEVLGMFVQQIGAMRDDMARAGQDERRRLAHTLKGSARGVGAFALADCAAEIEKDPTRGEAVRRLPELIDQVRDFVSTIYR